MRVAVTALLEDCQTSQACAFAFFSYESLRTKSALPTG